MTNQTNNNQFRDDEIVIISHWDKREEKWVKSIFPKVGGRLRLAHEDNENMSITTEISPWSEPLPPPPREHFPVSAWRVRKNS